MIFIHLYIKFYIMHVEDMPMLLCKINLYCKISENEQSYINLDLKLILAWKYLRQNLFQKLKNVYTYFG